MVLSSYDVSPEDACRHPAMEFIVLTVRIYPGLAFRFGLASVLAMYAPGCGRSFNAIVLTLAFD